MQTPVPRTPPPAAKSTPFPTPSSHAAIQSILSALPSHGAAFTRFQTSPPPPTFPLYLPRAADAQHATRLRTERTRCIIRALKTPAGARARRAGGGGGGVGGGARRRHQGDVAARERKQACLRVALAAAWREGGQDELASLKRDWMERPGGKRWVGKDVRWALWRSCAQWSVRELREYVRVSEIRVGAGREEMIKGVRAHLVPEE